MNGEFLDWLSRRRQPRRPFFAFLNYVDAHAPYLLPPGASHRFGSAPTTDADVRFLADGWTQADKRRIPEAARMLAIDAYDNCLAYLDERLGELIDDLERRGVLDQTLVIVTADHGEGLGEHGLFDHGESLYGPEIRVPLLIVLPADRDRSPVAVAEFVSLRDLAATIADFVRPGTKSPFPGRSLLTLGPTVATPAATAPSPSRRRRGALGAGVAQSGRSQPGSVPRLSRPARLPGRGDFVYIRNEGNGNEELFNQREDPYELNNLARAEAMRPVLRRFRDRLLQSKARAHAVGDPAASPRVASMPNVP